MRIYWCRLECAKKRVVKNSGRLLEETGKRMEVTKMRAAKDNISNFRRKPGSKISLSSQIGPTTPSPGYRTRKSFFLFSVIFFIFITIITLKSQAAEIYIDRVGNVQVDINDLSDGSSNDLRNDPVPDFNIYTSRWDMNNPLEWSHNWSLAAPGAGTLGNDPDEVFNAIIAAELFPLIWDIDYPAADQHDNLFWDSVAYAGGPGAAFDISFNPGAVNLGRIEGSNNLWDCKRFSLDPTQLAPGDTEYFFLQVDEDAGGSNWRSSIDYADLTIIYNTGDLTITKELVGVTGFNPPRVGYTTIYTVRINISNNTLTSTGGPMYDVSVTDAFPAGSTIVNPPAMGAAAIDAAGNLTWNVGVLEDGALNVPPAPNSSDFLDVEITVSPSLPMVGAPYILNNGATITGKQIPEDPGDGTGTFFPLNFYSDPANTLTLVTPPLATANINPSNTGTIDTTPSIIPGDAIVITVEDADLNFATDVVETVQITAVNLTTGESEDVICTETGQDTGIFTAFLPTAFGPAAGADDSGSMNVQAGDTVRGTYNDVADATGNPAAATDDTLVTGGDTASLASTTPIYPGDGVTITLEDNDLNASPVAVDTVLLWTTNTRTGEAEQLTYTETGPDTGIFTASLATDFGAGAGAGADGRINCISGDNLVTNYNDMLTDEGDTANISATTAVLGGADGILTITPNLYPGDPIAISVTDADLDTNPGVVETKSITVVHNRTGESEVIVLTETGPNTGVFSGQAATAFGAAPGAGGDGSFNTIAGDTLTAQYTDALTAAGGATTLTGVATVLGGADAAITATPAIIPGDPAVFTLDDADLDTNPAAVENYAFILTNPGTGESENITFTETGAGTGIFTATVNTAYGAGAGVAGDSSFNVTAGDQVVFTYQDVMTAAGGTTTLSAATTVTGGTTAVLTAPAQLAPGDNIDVSLSDADLNTNPAAAETVDVDATNSATGEKETLTLTETGVNTGIFEISFPTSYTVAAGVDEDGVFNVIHGHVVNFSYIDTFAADGGPAALADTTTFIDNSNTITITGPSGAFNFDTHDVTGTTEPFNAVTMVHPTTGAPLSTNADGAGNFTFPGVQFPEGQTFFTVTSTDPSGNIAAAAENITVDTTNFIQIISPIPGSAINSTTFDFAGLTDPFSTVTVIEPGTGAPLSTVADAAGNFTFPGFNLAEGVNNMNFQSTDPLGNPAQTPVTITVDLHIVLDIDNPVEGAVYTTAEHEIAGTTDPLATVTTTDPVAGGQLTVIAAADGSYSFGSFHFEDGDYTVSVHSKDEAGNEADASVSFKVDTRNANDLATSGLFNVSSLDLEGTTDPLSTVTMVHPVTGANLSTAADAAGNYIFAGTNFPDGTYDITTVSTDPYGNVAEDTETITIDTTIALLVTAPPDGSVIADTTADITGTTDPGSTVTALSPATGVETTVTAGAGGQFSFPGFSLAEGENIIAFTSVDPAGNVATVDHTLYSYPELDINITYPRDGSVVTENSIDVTGFTSPFVTVTTLHPETGATLTVKAGPDGRYTFPALPFHDGSNSITVTAHDDFGATAEATSSFIVWHEGVDAVLETSVRTVFGNPIFITVYDGETYLDQNTKDTVEVVVRNPATGDEEKVELTETGPATGIFKGRMNTLESSASDGHDSGVLAVNYGDTVTTTYMDLIRADLSTDFPLRSDTLITNDMVKIHVMAKAINGGLEEVALSGREISIREFDADGAILGDAAVYTTTEQGYIPSEFIGLMRLDRKYRIVLNEYYNGLPYSQSLEFDLSSLESIEPDDRGVRVLIVVLDPIGYVYDAFSGRRINGADVMLYHDGASIAEGPFGYHTRVPTKKQSNPQQTGDCGVDGGFEFVPSGNNTDIQPGRYYVEVQFNSNPSLAEVYDPVTRTDGAWEGIHRPYTGEVFQVYKANEPIAMRIPVWQVGAPMPLSVAKTANKDKAAPGDIVTFTVTVTNLNIVPTDPASPVVLSDTLPTGLEYIPNSAVFDDGSPVPITGGGNTMQFTLASLQAAGDSQGGDSVTLHYKTSVDSSAKPDSTLSNAAIAMVNSITMSNTGVATIRIVPEPMFDTSTLIGKVFTDINGNGAQDSGERGIAGAGIILDDGTYIEADEDGKYSVPGIVPMDGVSPFRVVKLDTRTLPAGSDVTTPESLFVKIAPGTMVKANFGVTPSEGDNVEGETNSRSRGNLFVGFIDLAAGEIKSGAGETNRPDTEEFPEGGFLNGRGAFYFDGVLDGLDLTAAYDSEKRYSREIHPDRDRDRYYPTYGDNSKVKYPTESQGKLYVHARTDRFDLLHGNYTFQFQGTELAGVRRSLYGTKLEFGTRYTTGRTEQKDSLAVFTAKDKQLHARTELRSTGGSRYYLAHNDIAPGSETIRVEVRDAIAPDRVLSTKTLQKDIDYKINYYSGGIRLLRPEPINADSDALNAIGVIDGNPVWIVAEYLYSPDETDFGTVGARWIHEAGPDVSFGASYLRENVGGEYREMRGADFHVAGEDVELDLEMAESDSGGIPWFASLDGGRSFTRLGNRNNGQASALKGEVRFHLSESLELKNYYYTIDPEFSGAAYAGRGIRRAGTELNFKKNGREFKLEYSRATALEGGNNASLLNSGGGRTRTLRAKYGQELKNGKFEAEYLHNYDRGAAQFDTEAGITDSIAARLEKDLNERVSWYIRQQFTASTVKNHQTALGINYRLNEDTTIEAEGSFGSHGTGGRLGIEKTGRDGTRIYAAVESGFSHRTGEKEYTTKAGVSGDVNEDTNAYMEYGTTSGGDDSRTSRTFGLEHDLGKSDDLRASFRLERGEEKSSLNGRYFTTAAYLSAEYTLKNGIKLTGDVEFQRQSGSIAERYFGAHFMAEGKVSESLTLFGEYEYNRAEEVRGNDTDTKYSKTLFGFAYRPSNNDRLNLIGRIGRIHELRPDSTNGGASPDSVSTVLSIEALYEPVTGLRLRQKIASKNVNESAGPGPGSRSYTTLWVSGIGVQVSNKWDLDLEYRTRRQPSATNRSGGFALEAGYKIKDTVRLGIGYNFSDYTDNEFASDGYSAKGVFFRIQAKR